MSNPLQLYSKFLRNRLDCSSGFLDYLVEYDVLKDHQRNALKTLQNDYHEQNKQVLHLLRRRLSKPDSGNFDKILEALRNSGQEHLEQHIRNGKGTSDEDIDSSQACSPLTSSQINEISKLTRYLCNDRRLHCTKALLSKLEQEKCITKVHTDRLWAVPVEVDRSDMLVNLIKRGSIGSLLKTVDALAQFGQTEAAEKLRNTNSAYTAQIHVSFCIERKIKNENSRKINSEDEDRRSQSPFTGREEPSGGTVTNMSGEANVKYRPTTADGEPFRCKESNADSTAYDDAKITIESEVADFTPFNAATGSVAPVSAPLFPTGEIVTKNGILCRSLSNHCISNKGENILTEKGRLICIDKKNGNNRSLAVSNDQLEEAAIASKATVGYTSQTDISVRNGSVVCATGTTNNVIIYTCCGTHSNRNCSNCSEIIDNSPIIAKGRGNDIDASELSVQNEGMGNNLTKNETLNDLEQKLVLDLISHLKTLDEAKIEKEELLLERVLEESFLQRASSKEVKELLLQWLKAQVIRIEFGKSILLSYYCRDVSELKNLIKMYESNLLQKLITAFVMAFIKDKKEYGGLTVANVEIYESDLEDMKRWCERVSTRKREQMFLEGRELSTSRTMMAASAALTSSLLGIHKDCETIDTAPMSSLSFEQPVSRRKSDSSSLSISLSAEAPWHLSSSSSSDSFLSSDESEYEIDDVATSQKLLGFAGKPCTSESLRGDILEKQLDAGLRDNLLFGLCIPVAKAEAFLKLPMKGFGEIKGVTYLDNFYYALVNRLLYKFDAKPPYVLRESLEIPVIEVSTDIAACPRKKRLYVGDSGSKCIWGIDISNFKSSIIIKDGNWPLQFSITSDGCILTADYLFNIKVYTSDGINISGLTLRLPSIEFENLRHAIEKSSGHLLICCSKYHCTFRELVQIILPPEMVEVRRSLDQTQVLERAKTEKEQGKYLPVEAENKSEIGFIPYYHSITLTSSSASSVLSVATTNSMPIKPSVVSPRYIALGPPDSDTFFVCDCDNQCVLLVSGDMKTTRVIVDRGNGCPAWPCRIYYDVEHRRLLVGAKYDRVIHIFDL